MYYNRQNEFVRRVEMGTAAVQGALWGSRAKDWAEVQEGVCVCLYEDVLQKIVVARRMRLLDIGCGSGIFCQMAAQRGAEVSGLDAAEALLEIARERIAEGDFRAGEMEALPFADQSFDVVTGFNAFQFAGDPVKALQEARRVTRRGGKLVIAVLGRPEELEAAPYFAALGAFLPAPPAGAPGPFKLSMDGALEEAVSQAGMQPGEVEQGECLWEYPDESTLLRGLLSPGVGHLAIQLAGETAVREAVLKAVAPFRTAAGGYRMRNKARVMIVDV
jgi:SAM-dependent methyltransferase